MGTSQSCDVFIWDIWKKKLKKKVEVEIRYIKKPICSYKKSIFWDILRNAQPHRFPPSQIHSPTDRKVFLQSCIAAAKNVSYDFFKFWFFYLEIPLKVRHFGYFIWFEFQVNQTIFLGRVSNFVRNLKSHFFLIFTKFCLLNPQNSFFYQYTSNLDWNQ